MIRIFKPVNIRKMKRKMRYYFPLLLIFSSLFSQAQQITTGKTNSQVRTLNNFNFIDLNMSGNVYVKQSDAFNVVVEAPSEIIDKITTEVSDNTLHIDNKNKYTVGVTPPVKIYVSMPRPNGFEVDGSGSIIGETNIITNLLLLEVNGSGNIKMMEITAAKLNVQMDGSGSVEMEKGIVENALIEVEGSGNYKGNSLSAKIIAVSLDGSGNISMPEIAAEKLWVKNTGSGDIHHVSGMAMQALFENDGSGNISAGDLSGSFLTVENSGSGNIAVGASETLHAELSGSGDIRYKGMPKTMRQEISGSGNFSKD